MKNSKGRQPLSGQTAFSGWSTQFVGRVQEIEALSQLITHTRLLTVAGIGGSGKTRLVMRVASHATDSFDQTYYIDLPESRESLNLQLPESILAESMGMHEQPNVALRTSIIHKFEESHDLLILDNCEHQQEACAELAHELIQKCPRLHVVLVSRQPLGVEGETVWLMPPMSMADSIHLFQDRASLTSPGFSLSHENQDSVAQICRRVDGIPLAIELAAARLLVLSPQQISQRLRDALSLLKSSEKLPESRYRTLRGALDWSYEQLAPDEKKLLQRMSVFSGAFDLPAMESVCSDEAVQAEGMLDLTMELASRSLVNVEHAHPDARYRLLEPIRQYAGQKLRTSGDETNWLDKHAAWYLRQAESVVLALRSARQFDICKRIENDESNYNTAANWFSASGKHDFLLRLAASLWWYWECKGQFTIGRTQLLSALQLEENSLQGATRSIEMTSVRAQALAGAGTLAWYQDDHLSAQDYLAESISLAEKSGDEWTYAYCLFRQARLANWQGDYGRAIELASRSIALYQKSGDEWAATRPMRDLGLAELESGNSDKALSIFQSLLDLRRKLNDREGMADALNFCGDAYLVMGDAVQATHYHRQALKIQQDLDFRLDIAQSLFRIGFAEYAQGHFDESNTCLREALIQCNDLGDLGGIAFSLIGLALIASTWNNDSHAAMLIGGLESICRPVDLYISRFYRPLYDNIVSNIRGRLGTAFENGYSEGASLLKSQLVELGLDGPSTAMGLSLNPIQVFTSETSQTRPQLRVFGLGVVRIYRGDTLLTHSDWTYTKAKELVVFLLCHAGATRDQIGIEFWPDASTEQVRSRLSAVLTHARNALGKNADWIVLVESQYFINPRLPVWFDVDVFTKGVKAATQAISSEKKASAENHILSLEEVIALYQGDFAADFSNSTWPIPIREKLQQDYLTALITLGRLHFEAGHMAQAISAYRKAIEQDPYLESAYCGLMRCHARQGERNLMKRDYQQIADLLRKEMGTTPAPETTNLYQQLIAS